MILLARHGETDDNRPPLRFQGLRDTPLNARGRGQAAALAERVAAEYEVSALWCSTLSRARETAALVGARIGLEPRPDARLCEGGRGRWEGRLFAEVEEAEPEAYAAWRRPDPGWRFPGGESLREQQDRVLAALSEVEDRALVVCHGGSIRVVLCARDPRGLAAFHDWKVPNTTVVGV